MNAQPNQFTDDRRPWTDEETLREMYCEDGMSTTEVADELGCASSTVCRWLEKLGIGSRTVSESLSKEPYQLPDHVDMTEEEWSELSRGNQYYYINRDKHRKAENERRWKRKDWVDEIKTDKGCRRCGFDDHPAALEFHHREAEEKRASVSDMAGTARSKEMIREEMEKCVLLCSNCHRAIEAGKRSGRFSEVKMV